MSNTEGLERFIVAAVEAMSDFSIQMLGAEDSIDPDSMEPIKEWDSHACLGSYLPLNCGEDLIEVGFMSSEDVLRVIVKRMLELSGEEDLPRDDMIDATKEIINIISGGIKCRLNEKVDGGILLGLPSFSEKPCCDLKKNNTLVGKLHVANMPVFLSIRSGVAH